MKKLKIRIVFIYHVIKFAYRIAKNNNGILMVVEKTKDGASILDSLCHKLVTSQDACQIFNFALEKVNRLKRATDSYQSIINEAQNLINETAGQPR